MESRPAELCTLDPKMDLWGVTCFKNDGVTSLAVTFSFESDDTLALWVGFHGRAGTVVESRTGAAGFWPKLKVLPENIPLGLNSLACTLSLDKDGCAA